jgi:hypothetical protein
MIRALKRHVPWWVKLSAKLVLARVPLTYAIWRRVGIFEHGAMLDSAYAIGVFERHFERTASQWTDGATILELGPGDSLATALIAKSHGAGRTWLVDAGRFASPDVAAYRGLAAQLSNGKLANGQQPPSFASLDELLAWAHCSYLVDGLKSLSEIPADSIRFSFSQAVLEHVRRNEFDATLRELFRVMQPGAITSHVVDLQDHLAQSLNSLRFSRARWESPLFSSSGFYTNRLRMGQIVEKFRAAGFEIQQVTPERWPAVPVSRRKLDPEFAAMPDEELSVLGFTIVARKPLQ